MAGPVSPAQDLAEPQSQFSASLFTKLPAEIRLEILSCCPQNDLICLSLSSHYFRELTLPLITKVPPLHLCDQNLPPGVIPCVCGNDRPMWVEHSPRDHRKRQHAYAIKPVATCSSYPDGCICRRGSSFWGVYAPEHPVCRRPGCRHCMCISCPLYARLRGWMGKDLRYCSKCRKFTKREWTKKYNGRCLHGRPKVRKSSDNHWTAVKGQSYGYRWWRRWGTTGVYRWGLDDDDEHVEEDSLSLNKRRNARVV
ncbi:F-box domain-containing protein [Colletotrichum cereale]|nr:F-box domain-containing protein [Colletotrichum cereale]